jgi:hypothetical protein
LEEWVKKSREINFQPSVNPFFHHSIIPVFQVLLFPFAGIIPENVRGGKKISCSIALTAVSIFAFTSKIKELKLNLIV